MILKQVICDTCNEVVQGLDGSVIAPFVGFTIDRAKFKVIPYESAEAGHICADCLESFVELQGVMEKTQFVGHPSYPERETTQ